MPNTKVGCREGRGGGKQEKKKISLLHITAALVPCTLIMF
jgi:hypothetical protein